MSEMIEFDINFTSLSYMGQIQELEKVEIRAIRNFQRMQKSAICRTTKTFGLANIET